MARSQLSRTACAIEMRFGRSKTYDKRCPDGTVHTIYRNVDDAFPLYIKGWKGGGKLSVSDLAGDTAALGAAYESAIQGLLYGLSELNESVMLNFRTIYLGYKSNPCGNADFFIRKLDELTSDIQLSSRVRLQIQGLVGIAQLEGTSSDEVWRTFNQIVGTLGGAGASQAAATSIRSARVEASRWIEGTAEEDAGAVDSPDPSRGDKVDLGGDGTGSGADSVQ